MKKIIILLAFVLIPFFSFGADLDQLWLIFKPSLHVSDKARINGLIKQNLGNPKVDVFDPIHLSVPVNTIGDTNDIWHVWGMTDKQLTGKGFDVGVGRVALIQGSLSTTQFIAGVYTSLSSALSANSLERRADAELVE